MSVNIWLQAAKSCANDDKKSGLETQKNALKNNEYQTVINNLKPYLEANELESNLNTGLITTIIPGLVIVGSVFLIHMGIIGSIVVFNIGLLTGVANSMWPLVEHHNKKKAKKRR